MVGNPKRSQRRKPLREANQTVESSVTPVRSASDSVAPIPDRPEDSFPQPYIWNWNLVGVIVGISISSGLALMLAAHPLSADGFFIFSGALLLAKFLTWNDGRHKSRIKPWRFNLAGATLIVAVTVGGIAWNQYLNGSTRLPLTGEGKGNQMVIGVDPGIGLKNFADPSHLQVETKTAPPERAMLPPAFHGAPKSHAPTAPEIAAEMAKLQKAEEPNALPPQMSNSGNLKERSIALAREMIVELYSHGWPQHPGAHPYASRFDNQIERSLDSFWISSRSDRFYVLYARRLKGIRDEMIQLHLRGERIEFFFATYTLPDGDKYPISGRTLLPQEIESMADELVSLSEKLR